MKLVFTGQPVTTLNPKVFLAGPTPRRDDVKSWRPEAVTYFEEELEKSILFKNLELIIPEPNWEEGQSFSDLDLEYDRVIEWEQNALGLCHFILFWVPRELKDMPAFTTNTEFGMCVVGCPQKVHYGRPDDAPKNRYLDYTYNKKTHRTPRNSLKTLVDEVSYHLDGMF